MPLTIVLWAELRLPSSAHFMKINSIRPSRIKVGVCKDCSVYFNFIILYNFLKVAISVHIFHPVFPTFNMVNIFRNIKLFTLPAGKILKQACPTQSLLLPLRLSEVCRHNSWLRRMKLSSVAFMILDQFSCFISSGLVGKIGVLLRLLHNVCTVLQSIF